MVTDDAMQWSYSYSRSVSESCRRFVWNALSQPQLNCHTQTLSKIVGAQTSSRVTVHSYVNGRPPPPLPGLDSHVMGLSSHDLESSHLTWLMFICNLGFLYTLWSTVIGLLYNESETPKHHLQPSDVFHSCNRLYSKRNYSGTLEYPITCFSSVNLNS
jgi:hypothetical protein